MTEIIHETGYKDDYKVTVKNISGEEWSPTNQELFKLCEKIFESEEQEFGSGYGNQWLWFYMSTIMLGEENVAYEAYGLRGGNAVAHFEKTVEKYGDELIETIEQLQKEVK